MGSYDYWVIKVDSLGSKQWEKRFGGTYDDLLFSVQQTTDGGFILGGHSRSAIGGDKTQPAWGHQIWIKYDYWIVKIDALGNKQWDKRFGGDLEESLYVVRQTSDGGYILGGVSNSLISGDKTQQNWDSLYLPSLPQDPANNPGDFWIVKTDSQGNKQWDKRFGGVGRDGLTSLQQTLDGGFILGGQAASAISGDKTQSNWDSTGNTPDYWVVKIDAIGNKQWDKRFGGTGFEILGSVQQTADGGYILSGTSASGANGDKTQPGWGDWDYWIVKIDSYGNKQWDKVFGGTGADGHNYDFGGSVTVSETIDQGYLICGPSQSGIGGDKTEDNLVSTFQTWIIKTDKHGNKQWDKTIFTRNLAATSAAIQTSDGDYVVANASYSGVGGYKTQTNWDTIGNTTDYWIVKFQYNALFLCGSLNVTTNSVTAHVTCFGASDGAAKAIVSGGTSPYSFLWSDGQTTSTPTGFPAGTYSVTVSDSNSCTATTSITIADGPICTGVQEYLLDNISLYPNPTDGKVTLQMSSLQEMTSVHLKLYDALGRQVMDQRVESTMIQQGITIDIKSLPGNIFILNITTEAGSRVMKVVKY